MQALLAEGGRLLRRGRQLEEQRLPLCRPRADARGPEAPRQLEPVVELLLARRCDRLAVAPLGELAEDRVARDAAVSLALVRDALLVRHLIRRALALIDKIKVRRLVRVANDDLLRRYRRHVGHQPHEHVRIERPPHGR